MGGHAREEDAQHTRPEMEDRRQCRANGLLERVGQECFVDTPDSGIDAGLSVVRV